MRCLSRRRGTLGSSQHEPVTTHSETPRDGETTKGSGQVSKYHKSVRDELIRVQDRLLDKGFVQADTTEAARKAFNDFDNMNKLSLDVYRCKACDLRIPENRGPVPGVGPINSPLMIIAEAPSTVEDLMGLPLVGESGLFFTIILNKAGVDRQLVRITNIVKCKGTDNATPSKDQINACGTHLLNEIAIIQPKVILTLGNEALRFLSGDPNLKITQERGNWRLINGIQVMPTFHPQYILRQQTKEAMTRAKKQIWADVSEAVAKAREWDPNYEFMR